jgi:hypothetical protein
VRPEQVLAFRLAPSGLAVWSARGLAEAAACPTSDFSRRAALLALAARVDGLSREAYASAVDAGELVVAHIVRGAIHALAPGDLGLYGRALIARDDAELGPQLGRQVQRLAAERGFAPSEDLEEVAAATTDALARGRALGRDELHEELRARVSPDLMPWCRSCRSNHVAPMLWRYATVAAGVRLDARRRYAMGAPGRTPAGGEARAPLPALLGAGEARRLRRVGRPGEAPRPTALGRDVWGPRRGRRRGGRRLGAAGGRGGAGGAARR